VGGIAIDVTARMKAEEQGRRYAAEVRELMDQLVVAQESERRRVAEELHDLIGQNLTALGIDLASLKQGLGTGQVADGPAARLDGMRRLLEETIGSIRGVMSMLRPPDLEEYGLVPALRWSLEEFSRRTGMHATLRSAGTERRLAPEAELALFRIVQEAMVNAGKHSGGVVLTISIEHGADRLHVSIEDDGLGFPNRKGARTARRGGWGLRAMRERAATYGGTLRVEFPTRGTRVVVELPFGAEGRG
jgi:signal transduction histidine kinase